MRTNKLLRSCLQICDKIPKLLFSLNLNKIKINGKFLLMDPKKVSRTEAIERKFDDWVIPNFVPFCFIFGTELKLFIFKKFISFTFYYFFFGTKIKLNVSKKKYFIFVPERE